MPPGMGSRLHGNDGWHGESPSPQPSPVEGEGDGVAPGMGSRLHGNDGWHGESPSPQPSPVEGEGDGVPPGMGSRLHGNDGGALRHPHPSRERGQACRRGWVPVCTGTTGMGSSLTPALSRQGRGGRRPFPSPAGGWVRRLCTGTTVAWGSHPHPNPLPSRERGSRGWVPVSTGTTVALPSWRGGRRGAGWVPVGSMGQMGGASTVFKGAGGRSGCRRAGYPVLAWQRRRWALPSRERGTVAPGWVPPRERRLAWGSHPHPNPLPSRERGTAWAPGMGSRSTGTGGLPASWGTAWRRRWVPVSTGRRLAWGSHPPPSPFKGEGDGVAPGMGSRCTGTTVGMGESPSPQPSPVKGEGDGVEPGMGSRLHGNDGWHGGVTLTLNPLPSRERGTAWRRGWVPVSTGTTVAHYRQGRGGRRGRGWVPVSRERRLGMGSHPHPSPLPSRRGGRRAAGDGFPFARERRLAWGVTLTPALSRRGRGGSRPPPRAPAPCRVRGRISPLPSRERGTACRRGWVPVCTGTTVGMGSHPHPSPLPSRERGTAWRRGWVPVCTGTTGVVGSHPHSVEGEGDGVPPGMGSRLHGNDGWHGESPHPNPLPSRERGTAWRRGWVPVCTGTTVGMGSHPHSFEGEGDRVPPGMGSRLHGNDGWHGESPSPQRGLSTVRAGSGRGGRRGAGDGFPSTGTTVGMGSHPHPSPLPSRERGTVAPGDGFPSPRERRLAWGVTLTPYRVRGRLFDRLRAGSALCRHRERGTAWRRGWVPVCTGTTVGMGSHPHPSPLPSRERGFPTPPRPPAPCRVGGRLSPLPSRKRGTACRRGWVPVCTGTTVWVAGSC